jgi:hypothetical protein
MDLVTTVNWTSLKNMLVIVSYRRSVFKAGTELAAKGKP